MGGGGKTEVKYETSPEQRQIYEMLQPLAQQMSTAGQAGLPTWNVPQMPSQPQYPSMQGALTGIPMYNVPNYNLPNVPNLMPTQSWYNSLSPDVKAGVWAPYQEAAQQLTEQFGSRGQLGSARAGYSGAYGAAMGEFASNAAQQVGLQTWNMAQPQIQMAQQAWQTEAARRAAMQQQYLTREQANYQNITREREQDYMTAMMSAQNQYQGNLAGWQAQLQSVQYPYTALPGMVGGTYGQPVVQPGTAGWQGAAMGGLAGYYMGGWPGLAMGAYAGYYS